MSLWWLLVCWSFWAHLLIECPQRYVVIIIIVKYYYCHYYYYYYYHQHRHHHTSVKWILKSDEVVMTRIVTLSAIIVSFPLSTLTGLCAARCLHCNRLESNWLLIRFVIASILIAYCLCHNDHCSYATLLIADALFGSNVLSCRHWLMQ